MQIFQPNTDMNTRVLKNEATDITTFVKNIDPGGRTRTFSVFSLNQASVTGNAVSCGYQTPVEGSVYNLGSNLSFRFQAAGRPSIAETAHSWPNLEARLSLVRLVEGRAPEQVEVKVVGISDDSTHLPRPGRWKNLPSEREDNEPAARRLPCDHLRRLGTNPCF